MNLLKLCKIGVEKFREEIAMYSEEIGASAALTVEKRCSPLEATRRAYFSLVMHRAVGEELESDVRLFLISVISKMYANKNDVPVFCIDVAGVVDGVQQITQAMDIGFSGRYGDKMVQWLLHEGIFEQMTDNTREFYLNPAPLRQFVLDAQVDAINNVVAFNKSKKGKKKC